MNENSFQGFDDLCDLLNDYASQASEESVLETLELGAEELVKVLLKLPKPKSNINKQGYTHMVDTFSKRRNRGQIEVGWGKYYGPIVEKRTHQHLCPSWERNKEMIYKKMLDRVWKG